MTPVPPVVLALSVSHPSSLVIPQCHTTPNVICGDMAPSTGTTGDDTRAVAPATGAIATEVGVVGGVPHLVVTLKMAPLGGGHGDKQRKDAVLEEARPWPNATQRPDCWRSVCGSVGAATMVDDG
jgi:hypothetical protein